MTNTVRQPKSLQNAVLIFVLLGFQVLISLNSLQPSRERSLNSLYKCQSMQLSRRYLTEERAFLILVVLLAELQTAS